MHCSGELLRCARNRILMYQSGNEGCCAPCALHFIPKNEFLEVP